MAHSIASAGIVAAVLLAMPCAGVAQHPQAVTDCSNCHLDATGEPDLQALHSFDCVACHPGFNLSATILGPIGTWNNECSACHNPCVAETGNLPVHTKGHRCVACHGEQRNTHNVSSFHRAHIESANCVVCHGFIPDVGTEIGTGNRNICTVCHGDDVEDASVRELHEKHVPEGLSCLECHGGERPPVDVVEGPPVGMATNVCQICHEDRHPSDFLEDFNDLHRKHTDERIDCGACHMAANLQDDRSPMPPIDDAVRAQLDRGGFGACSHCHDGSDGHDEEDDESETGIVDIHRKHVADQWQWCYTCHEGGFFGGPVDERPLGVVPPVQEPAQSCQLCHESKTYNDAMPFAVHKKHADKDKCYACHQTSPPLFDWPDAWYSGLDDGGYGELCPSDADFDGDGLVGFNDLVMLLGAWGPCAACAEDLDASGSVGFSDLSLLLGLWGPA